MSKGRTWLGGLVGLAVFAAAAATGCKGDSSSKPAGEADKPALATNSISAKEPNFAQAFTEAKTRALFDRWLRAQNEGDFKTYQSLFATRFGGVKRAADRVTRFSRDGWLADRKRMFSKPMKVSVSEQQFEVSPVGASVTFTQRWSSGSFEDVGPKRISLTSENGKLRIAQEVMIASEQIGGSPDSSQFDYHVVWKDMLILHGSKAPNDSGTIRFVSDEDSIVSALAELRDEDVDEIATRWKGETVKVDGECEATVTGFGILTRVVPHFGVRQHWDCTDGVEKFEGCAIATTAKKAKDVFELGEGVVVAKLSGCEGSYARSPSAKPLVVGRVTKDEQIAAMARKAFGKLSEVRALGKGARNWWHKNLQVMISTHPKSGQTTVSTSAYSGHPCNGDEISWWQLWRLDGAKLVPLAASPGPLKVVAAVDANDDGTFEYLVNRDHFGAEIELIATRTMQPLVRFGFDYLDGC